MAGMKSIRLGFILPVVVSAALSVGKVHTLSALQNSPASANGSTTTQADGSHDFDFLIGDWKAHIRRLPERLKGSNVWVEYNGISNHKKLLDSNANFEEFDVSTPDHKLRIKAQTLRLYNPESYQWSIYLVDLDKGTLELPPVVGQFYGKRGEFFNQQVWEGRAVLVRYVWLDISPNHHEWSSPFRQTAERHGKLIGYVSSHDRWAGAHIPR
jgi:hypothetical protein